VSIAELHIPHQCEKSGGCPGAVFMRISAHLLDGQSRASCDMKWQFATCGEVRKSQFANFRDGFDARIAQPSGERPISFCN
jgi:hypothetical protein